MSSFKNCCSYALIGSALSPLCYFIALYCLVTVLNRFTVRASSTTWTTYLLSLAASWFSVTLSSNWSRMFWSPMKHSRRPVFSATVSRQPPRNLFMAMNLLTLSRVRLFLKLYIWMTPLGYPSWPTIGKMRRFCMFCRALMLSLS